MTDPEFLFQFELSSNINMLNTGIRRYIKCKLTNLCIGVFHRLSTIFEKKFKCIVELMMMELHEGFLARISNL